MGREEVLAVLGEHLPTWTDHGFVCKACGHVFVSGNPGSYSGFRDPDEVKALIRAHAADALMPVIERREREAAAAALIHARACVTQYVATAEKWRYDRVVWAFGIMLGEIPEGTPEPMSPADEAEAARRANAEATDD